MVSTRINFFCYAIIFMALHFVAHSLQDIDKMVMFQNKLDVEEIRFPGPEKETLNEVHVSSEVAVKGGVIGGRKMARRVNQEHTKDEEPSKKSSSSSSGNRNGDHKQHQISKKIDQVEVKMSSTFMVMNADYHVPRSHPPKNN
ncbi:hypothetical protein SSX86_024899 [Deinandra increscens subsp. villosa]|uniref:Uncharacterized protein n=1 Tax=Deinandra increscens subsp. villosa TaxID=3103831 RepID=A0AAP0CBJ4_9ASTR